MKALTAPSHAQGRLPSHLTLRNGCSYTWRCSGVADASAESPATNMLPGRLVRTNRGSTDTTCKEKQRLEKSSIENV